MYCLTFFIREWMGLTGCSEVQALNAAATYIKGNKPEAAHFARQWGVNSNKHISDFMEVETHEERSIDEYSFSVEDDNIIHEGWIE